MTAIAVAVTCAAPSHAVSQTTPDWRPIRGTEPRSGHALAYDFTRGRVVMFGGMIPAAQLADSWEWDGSVWAQLSSATRPTPRTNHAMAGDAGLRQVVLFGGARGSTVLEDTWTWDGVTWTQRNPAHVPARRYDHSMADDPVRHVVALFGGRMGPVGAELFDLYEWNGTDWIVRGATVHPAERSQASLAYDAAGGRLVLFGGINVAGTVFGDMWAWDGTSWTQLAPAALPPARFGASMVGSIAGQRVVLHGGQSAGWPRVVLADTWIWDGASWNQQSAPVSPPASARLAASFDEARQRLVLFGSPATTTSRSETWEFDGAAWQQRRVVVDPPEREALAMTFDDARQRAVLFGGTYGGGTSLADTWEHDGAVWSERHPVTSPPARVAHAMAWNPASGATVLFGGTASYHAASFRDTWEWNGVVWAQRQPSTRPTARVGHKMAFDHASGRVLLFGGADSGSSSSRLGDTWVWDGVNWQQLFPASSPSPRATHAMASDPLRQRIVLFSGTSLNDTWEWNGSAWLSRMPATSPPFRGNAGMAYDADRQRIVLCGGSWSSYLDDTWEWDGTDWLQMPTATTFGGRAFHGVAYHTAIRRMLLFGGPYGYHDTWIYGDLVASTVQTLGPGCPGSAGLPRLALSDPYVGNPEFALDLLDVPPSAGCAFGLDTVTQSLPIGGGCTVWLWNPALYFVVARASGCASFRLAIPLDPGLRGAVFHAQAAVFDPLGPAAGIALSAARTFVLGD